MSLSPCPTEGNTALILEQHRKFNDGTPAWRVICPVCRDTTPDMVSAAAATGTWNHRDPTTYTIHAWDALVTTYASGSLVSDTGLLYAGLAPVTGSAPSAAVDGEWMLLAN